MKNRVLTFLGLAAKARKLVSGEDTCERMVKSEKSYLVIVACDASDNTKKKFKDMCSYRGVEIRYYSEKELLGRYIGKEMRSVVAVLNEDFSKRLVQMIDSAELEIGGGHIGES